MRIVINALSARLGGGQTYLINLLRHLPKKNEIEIYIYAPASLELPPDKRIKRLYTKWRTDNPVIRSIWERLVLPRELKKLAADILFCPGGVVVTRAPTPCLTVTMFRNMIPFDPQVRKQIPMGLQRIRNWLLENVMLRSMSSADLVIFISNYARSIIESKTIIKNATTIPHGISAHFRSHHANPARPAFIPKGNYILYVSRFDVYKHHYEVVSAYENLPREIKDQYQLVLVGENDTPCGEQVKAFIRGKGLVERVRVIGAVKYELLPAVYRHADLILFASSCENCPNILLEALGGGRPILSSSIMPMPEFGGDAVAYFDPRDVNSIAEKITDLLLDREKATNLATRAASRSEDYDWGRTAEKTWDSLFALKA